MGTGVAEVSLVADERPARFLIGFSVLFVAAHVLLFDLNRFWEWDEATYVSQVIDGWTVPLGSHRARGMVYLAAPVLAISDTPWIVRSWLILVNTLALTSCVAILWRLVGRAAGVTAVLAGSFWAVLFFGSEVQPNQFVALAFLSAVLATVFTVTRGPTMSASVALTGSIATTFVLRPSDAVVASAAIILVGLILAGANRRRLLGVALAVFVGAVVGSLPWIYEAQTVYGGVLARWDDAAAVVRSGFQFHGLDYLRLLDGPMQGPDPGPIAWGGVVWVGVVLGLAVLACFLPAEQSRMRLARALCVAALVVAAPYLLYVGATTIRFLLPAYLVVACAAGIGAVEVWQRRRRVGARLIGGLALVALGVGVAWNVGAAVDFGDSEHVRRIGPKEVGEELALLSRGSPCRFASEFTYPVIALVSGCEGRHLPTSDLSMVASDFVADPGKARFLAFVHDPGDVLGPDWVRHELVVSTGGKWVLFQFDG